MSGVQIGQEIVEGWCLDHYLLNGTTHFALREGLKVHCLFSLRLNNRRELAITEAIQSHLISASFSGYDDLKSALLPVLDQSSPTIEERESWLELGDDRGHFDTEAVALTYADCSYSLTFDSHSHTLGIRAVFKAKDGSLMLDHAFQVTQVSLKQLDQLRMALIAYSEELVKLDAEAMRHFAGQHDQFAYNFVIPSLLEGCPIAHLDVSTLELTEDLKVFDTADPANLSAIQSEFGMLEFWPLASDIEHSLSDADVLVQQSPDGIGFGLIARRAIKPGAALEYKGTHEAYTLEMASTDNAYLMGADLVVNAEKKGSASRFANHSTDPNCRVLYETAKDQYILEVIRPIKAGEALTFHYGQYYHNRLAKGCGSSYLAIDSASHLFLNLLNEDGRLNSTGWIELKLPPVCLDDFHLRGHRFFGPPSLVKLLESDLEADAVFSGLVEQPLVEADPACRVLNIRDQSGLTPLMMACYLGRVAWVEHLLDCGANPHRLHRKEARNALMYAISSPDLDESQVLAIMSKFKVMDRPRVLVSDVDGRTSIHHAICQGYKSVVQVLMLWLHDERVTRKSEGCSVEGLPNPFAAAMNGPYDETSDTYWAWPILIYALATTRFDIFDLLCDDPIWAEIEPRYFLSPNMCAKSLDRQYKAVLHDLFSRLWMHDKESAWTAFHLLLTRYGRCNHGEMLPSTHVVKVESFCLALTAVLPQAEWYPFLSEKMQVLAAKGADRQRWDRVCQRIKLPKEAMTYPDGRVSTPGRRHTPAPYWGGGDSSDSVEPRDAAAPTSAYAGPSGAGVFASAFGVAASRQTAGCLANGTLAEDNPAALPIGL